MNQKRLEQFIVNIAKNTVHNEEFYDKLTQLWIRVNTSYENDVLLQYAKDLGCDRIANTGKVLGVEKVC